MQNHINNNKLKVLYLNIDYLLEGGVSRWIDIMAGATLDVFNSYVFTPNAMTDYKYKNISVVKFNHNPNDNLSKFNTSLLSFPNVSHYITTEMIDAIHTLAPDVIIVCGNNPVELFIPAIIERNNSLIIGRFQHISSNDYGNISIVNNYCDGIITFTDITHKMINSKIKKLSIYRTYDDSVFYNMQLVRYNNAIGYFGRFANSRMANQFKNLPSLLDKYNIDLHMYTLPTPPSLQSVIDTAKQLTHRIKQYKWINNNEVLAGTMNKYIVSIVPFTRSHDFMTTFGQATIEQIACGGTVIVVVGDGKSSIMQYKSPYMEYINNMLYVESNFEDAMKMANNILNSPSYRINVKKHTLKAFSISEQKDTFINFIIKLYNDKFKQR